MRRAFHRDPRDRRSLRSTPPSFRRVPPRCSAGILQGGRILPILQRSSSSPRRSCCRGMLRFRRRQRREPAEGEDPERPSLRFPLRGRLRRPQGPLSIFRHRASASLPRRLRLPRMRRPQRPFRRQRSLLRQRIRPRPWLRRPPRARRRLRLRSHLRRLLPLPLQRRQNHRRPLRHRLRRHPFPLRHRFQLPLRRLRLRPVRRRHLRRPRPLRHRRHRGFFISFRWHLRKTHHRSHLRRSQGPHRFR